MRVNFQSLLKQRRCLFAVGCSQSFGQRKQDVRICRKILRRGSQQFSSKAHIAFGKSQPSGGKKSVRAIRVVLSRPLKESFLHGFGVSSQSQCHVSQRDQIVGIRIAPGRGTHQAFRFDQRRRCLIFSSVGKSAFEFQQPEPDAPGIPFEPRRNRLERLRILAERHLALCFQDRPFFTVAAVGDRCRRGLQAVFVLAGLQHQLAVGNRLGRSAWRRR